MLDNRGESVKRWGPLGEAQNGCPMEGRPAPIKRAEMNNMQQKVPGARFKWAAEIFYVSMNADMLILNLRQKCGDVAWTHSIYV
jgi:hypothetical protein